ncbi:Homocysteine S-methyltransferase [Klebsiella pneumoniae]|nr:Homocysteine S-methyltransferase [Klebsiella pneumoniae]
MSQTNPFTALLDAQPFVLLDGAMATELEAAAAIWPTACGRRKCCWRTRSWIRDVHLDYFRAGAQVAITASYQATPAGFAARGLDEAQSRALIGKSVELARKAREAYLAENPQAGTLLVAGSVGPYGAFLADARSIAAIISAARQSSRPSTARASKRCWMPAPTCWPVKPCRHSLRSRPWRPCCRSIPAPAPGTPSRCATPNISATARRCAR